MNKSKATTTTTENHNKINKHQKRLKKHLYTKLIEYMKVIIKHILKSISRTRYTIWCALLYLLLLLFISRSKDDSVRSFYTFDVLTCCFWFSCYYYFFLFFILLLSSLLPFFSILKTKKKVSWITLNELM